MEAIETYISSGTKINCKEKNYGLEDTNFGRF